MTRKQLSFSIVKKVSYFGLALLLGIQPLLEAQDSKKVWIYSLETEGETKSAAPLSPSLEVNHLEANEEWKAFSEQDLHSLFPEKHQKVPPQALSSIGNMPKEMADNQNKGSSISLKEALRSLGDSPKVLVREGEKIPLSDKDLLAQVEAAAKQPLSPRQNTILINFNNVGMVEYIRFISKVAGKNFIFSESDLQFPVTIVSEKATTIENVMTTLLQELRIRGLNMMEEGNAIVIFQGNMANAPGIILTDASPQELSEEADIVTRVFQLNTSSAAQIQGIITPILSPSAVVTPLTATNQLIVTDLHGNVRKIRELIQNIDAPNSGLVIGQYAVRRSPLIDLIENGQRILASIANEQSITLVPHANSNSIFIVASPFLVERAIPILEKLDQGYGTTNIFNLNDLKFTGSSSALTPGGEIPSTPQFQVPVGTRLLPLDQQGQIDPTLVKKDGEGNLLIPLSTLRELLERLRAVGETLDLPAGVTLDDLPLDANGNVIVPLPLFRRIANQAQKQQIQFAVTPDGTLLIVPESISSTQKPSASKGRWRLDANGNWIYEPAKGYGSTGSEFLPAGVDPFELDSPPRGIWRIDPSGRWEFNYDPTMSDGEMEKSEKPKGKWVRDPDNRWRFELQKGQSIYPASQVRPGREEAFLPAGQLEKTKFYIQKLQYRSGDSIQQAVQQIGMSLRESGAANKELIDTITSMQWLEASNSLVYTGIADAILKVKELVEEIDTPLRQVFIEMLILDTTIDDSLEYGVNWGSKFGGGDTAGAQAFISGTSPINAMLATSGANSVPSATAAISQAGYNLGIIGQRITSGGVDFATLSAFVRAIHEKNDTNIVMTPKIITEDNVTAEIFVGENTPYRTQSISNDQGSVITSNFEYRDIGTTLKVTPYLGPSNIITLDIEQEISTEVSGTATGGNELSDQAAGPTTRKSTTKTRVHVPDGYFVVLSGMINDSQERIRRHVPCLGGAPFIGALFSNKVFRDRKRNLMIFIRPQLIDTEQEIQDLTKSQQNIYRIKGRTKKMWRLDTEEALDWLNLKDIDTLNDEKSICEYR